MCHAFCFLNWCCVTEKPFQPVSGKAANVTVPSAGAWGPRAANFEPIHDVACAGKSKFFPQRVPGKFSRAGTPLPCTRPGPRAARPQVGVSGGGLRLPREALLQEQPRRKLTWMII